MSAAHEWLRDNHDAGQTVCLIGVENTASLRVAEKLGYQAFERCSYRDRDCILFRRPRD
jgi:RimJ/RimL family protein N-acetyltransferase